MTEGAPNGARPRVLFVGRNRYTLPLPGWLAKKWDAVERQLDYRILASAPNAEQPLLTEKFHLIPPARPGALDGLLFYARLPFLTRSEIKSFRPEAIVASDPYIGAAALIGRALTRAAKPQVILEVHGDWRTFTRMYGSPRRAAFSPVADRISRFAVRRGDAVRALSPYTESLVEEVRGVPVTASFPTYTDLSAFTEEPVRPLPERPTATFVGMLEAYKNIDALADAWRAVHERLPEALLLIVGDGARRSVVERLVAELPDAVEWHPSLPPAEVSAAIDRGTFLALPSRSEGLGRVVIEAFARGRGVVAAGVGGIPDLVTDGVEGLLVDPTDTDAIVDSLVRVLSDRELAERFGTAGSARYRAWHTTPVQYAAQVRELVDATLRDAGAAPAERPRVLIVSPRTPSPETLGALRDELDYLVLGRVEPGEQPRRAAVGPGSVHLAARRFYFLRLPFRVRGLVRRFRPQIVIAESPHVGFLVLAGLAFRRRPALVVEAPRDWRAASHEGSRARILVAPLLDWSARYALRRADALHTHSPSTASLAEHEAGVPPLESFPAYIDLSIFTGTPPEPLPATPTALFVGMLEAYKNVDGLADAWRQVAVDVPEARLVIVGKGAMIEVVERLLEDYPDRIDYHPELAPVEVSRCMDESTCLVLPSRSEGLGRVLIEAFARGRGAVASRVGGIPDVVRDGTDGLLVDPRNTDELSAALVRVLTDRGLAERLGEAASERYRDWDSTPDEYASRVRLLVDRTLAAS